LTPEDRVFMLDVDEQDYDNIVSKYITIPPGADGIEREGDSIVLTVEAGMADWKTPGQSLTVPLTVTQEGVNKGKQIDWFAGVRKDAMSVTKPALQAFGIENAVIKRINGKIAINPAGFVGAVAKATFKRKLSNKGNLHSVLDSTKFYPISEVATKAEEAPL
jgi:hypothetical protein